MVSLWGAYCQFWQEGLADCDSPAPLSLPKVLEVRVNSTSRQRAHAHNCQVYSSVDPRQQADELLETESLEASVLEVRYARFIDTKHVRCSKLVDLSNFREYRLSELLLQSGNWVIDHPSRCVAKQQCREPSSGHIIALISPA